MSFNFGNTSAIGTSTPAKRKCPQIQKFSLQIVSVFLVMFYIYVLIIFAIPLAGFGNFSFNAPATTAPPAFGTPAPTQSTGFGALPSFGQTSFGATSQFFNFFYIFNIYFH